MANETENTELLAEVREAWGTVEKLKKENADLKKKLERAEAWLAYVAEQRNKEQAS